MTDMNIMTEAEQLSAWNAWKKICFIPGCPEPAQGFLRRRVTSAMKQRLRRYGMPLQQVDDDLLISVFDQFLTYRVDNTPRPDNPDDPQDNGQTAEPVRLIFKQHKDYVWLKMRQSQDPPLKVINGKLLGDQGIIMDVMKFLLKTHYHGQEVELVNQESGKRVKRFFPHLSLQEQVRSGGEDSRTLEETLVDTCLQPPDTAAGENHREIAIAVRVLLDQLATPEKVLLLARLAALNLSDPIVCNALGRQKSAVSALWEKVETKLRQWRTRDDEAPKNLSIDLHRILCQTLLVDLDAATDLATRNLLQTVRRCLALP